MKRKLTTGMLLIGVILLGAFIWFFEQDSETSSQHQQRVGTVFSVYPESITSILTEREGVEIECSKVSGTWQLIRPAKAPVDNGIVEKMIAGMARVERGELIRTETLLERGLTSADYGFDAPRAKITFQNNRGTFTWLIGRDAPLGDRLYIMPAGGGDIIAAPQTLLNLIPKDPAWIRDHTLFHDDVAAVRGIDLRRPSGFLQLRQPEGNGWVMQQPHKGRVDVLSAHSLLEKTLSARIVEFIIDEKTDLTVYGLEEPAYELTLFTLDEQTQTLRVGKPHPDKPETRYAKWVENDSVFTVSAEWAEVLDMDNELLRNRHILGVLPARITELQLTQGEQQVDLVQTNGQWKITRPARWDTEPAQVKDLFQTLAQAMVINFVDNPSIEQSQLMTDAPWVLSFSADENSHTLRISNPNSDGLRLVQRDEESSLYTTTSNIIDEAFIEPLFFRSRTVLQIDPVQIKKITQETGEEKTCAQKLESTFSSMDRTHVLDSEAVFNLTSELVELRAARYVTFNPASLESYGLDNPPFRITVALSGTNTLGRAILLGNPVDGGRYAMVQGQSIVFVLDEQTAQTFTQKLTQPANLEITKPTEPTDAEKPTDQP